MNSQGLDFQNLKGMQMQYLCRTVFVGEGTRATRVRAHSAALRVNCRSLPRFAVFENVGSPDLDNPAQDYNRSFQYPGFLLVWATATI
jgi:hypothetical protein